MSEKRRRPAVAGMFYPASEKELRMLIEWSFRHKLGPRDVPKGEPGNANTIVAAQVPHAGYIYSGPAAAHVYYSLHQDTKPDTIIILGPNHTGLGLPVSVYPSGVWETPLGEVEVDEEVVKELVKSDFLDEDELAHTGEHSIEVQLPFLQYIYGDSFKIVPIVMMDQSIETSAKVAEAIIRAMRKFSDRRIIVLASSDMTHYESHSSAYKKDKAALSFIERLDVAGLYDYAERVGLSMCGIGPVAVAMYVAKEFGAQGVTLQYYTSGDIAGYKGAVVGYAAVVFAKGVLIRRKEAVKLPEAEEFALAAPP